MNMYITINTDNAAFENDQDQEIRDLLRRIAARTRIEGYIYDINGNRVGEVNIEGD